MRYRVWYGDGQVSNDLPLKQAEDHLAECHRTDNPQARLSRYEGNGDWSIRTLRGNWTLLL